MFLEKQRQKAVSRQLASKRRARKSSSRLSAAEASAVRNDLAPTSDPMQALPGVIDDFDQNLDSDLLFNADDMSHHSPTMLSPVHMAAHQNMMRENMIRTNSQSSHDHDLW